MFLCFFLLLLVLRLFLSFSSCTSPSSVLFLIVLLLILPLFHSCPACSPLWLPSRFLVLCSLPSLLLPLRLFPLSIVCLFNNVHVSAFLFLWRFYPIPEHGLPLLLFAIALMAHATLGRTPMDECLAHHSDLYSDNTQHSHETDTHASSGIRTHILIKRAAADPRFRQSGHVDQTYECRLYVQPELHIRYSDLASGCTFEARTLAGAIVWSFLRSFHIGCKLQPVS